MVKTRKNYRGGDLDLLKNGLLEKINELSSNLTNNIYDRINKLGFNIKIINTALKTPEGIELTNEAKILSDTISDILNPILVKAGGVTENSAIKVINTSIQMIVQAVKTFPPIALLNEIALLLTALINALTGVAELTHIGSNKVTLLKDKIEKANKLWLQFMKLLEETKRNIEDINKITSEIKKGGGKIVSLQKAGKLIGGRINKSKMEFLGSNIMNSQIIRKRTRRVKK
jgi:hypothetical protein